VIGAGGDLVGVQTPQAFRAVPLLAAYRSADADGFEGTDTASCLERYSPALRIAAVPSSSLNLKVTFPEDLALATALAPARD
jgi:2-C-methyl-D-erythritol 4-phosphate cytidylyltransferase